MQQNMNDRLEDLINRYQNALPAFQLVIREKRKLSAFGNEMAIFANDLFMMRMVIDRHEAFVSLSRTKDEHWVSLSYLLALLQPDQPIISEALAVDRMLQAEARIKEFFSSPYYDCLIAAYDQFEKCLNRSSLAR